MTTAAKLTPHYKARVKVLNEVSEEQDAQIEKWGEQSHPDGTGSMYALLAEIARKECDEAHKAGVGTWAHILKEEFYEALAESDPVALRAELIQVAAVAASWIRDLDNKN